MHYKIDEIALVGKPLVDIETEGEEQNEVPSEEVVQSQQEEKQPTPSKITVSDDKPSTEILCIPSVRRLAKEHKVSKVIFFIKILL